MKYIISILSLAMVLVFSACSENEYNYTETPEDAFALGKNIQLVPVEKLAQIIISKDTVNYQFVDVRTPDKYRDGHILNAVNLPLKDLYDKDLDVFCSTNTIFVIYGEDASQSRLAYSFLRQLGITNILPAGGYDFMQNNIIDNFGIKSGTYDDEVAKYDYAKVVANTAGNSVGSENTTPPPAPVVPVQQNKSESVGGCE